MTRLPKIVGLAQAKALVLMGERLTTAQAIAIGLVNEAVADEKLVGCNASNTVLIYDEILCGLSDPPMSSVQLDLEQMGYDAAELLEVCRRELPTYMVPARIVWRDALPRSPNGKIDRKTIAAELEQA